MIRQLFILILILIVFTVLNAISPYGIYLKNLPENMESIQYYQEIGVKQIEYTDLDIDPNFINYKKNMIYNEDGFISKIIATTFYTDRITGENLIKEKFITEIEYENSKIVKIKDFYIPERPTYTSGEINILWGNVMILEYFKKTGHLDIASNSIRYLYKKYKYQYVSQNLLSKILVQEKHSSEQNFEDKSEFLIFYNNNQQMIRKDKNNFDTSNSNITPFSKQYYNYCDITGNLIEAPFEYYISYLDTFAWRNNIVLSYTNSNFPTEITYYHRNNTEDEFNWSQKKYIERNNENHPLTITTFYQNPAKTIRSKFIYNTTPVAPTENAELNSYQTCNLQNYPNPFNPSTKISFDLSHKQNIELSIFNIKGQKVKTLFKGTHNKGKASFNWNGKNSQNQNVTSGIYFYKLKTKSKTYTNKMILLK